MNEENFEFIFYKYEPMIKKMIRTLSIYKDADEFYQIGSIALWEAWTKFDEKKGKFATFAFFTVRGRMLEQLKKSKRYEERNVVNFDTMNDLNHIIYYDTTLENESIKPYLASLSEKQKIWMIEAIVYQNTLAEIARQHNTSIEAVKSWRKEALKKLRARKQAFLQ